MGNSDGEDVGFKYYWHTDTFMTTSWRYTVGKDDPLQYRQLGSVQRHLSDSEEHLHEYVAFENVQYTNMAFPTLEEAKAWVVACTMGEKP